jgi:hypothetical protein
MGSHYTTDAIAALNNISQRLAAAGVNLGDDLDAIQLALTQGNLGIGAKAYDVDALCKDGGAFSYKADTTNGLTLGYFGGRLIDGQSIVTIATGTIILPASQANVYVELIYSAGNWIVSQNTAAFTAGGVPLFLCTTGVSTINTITNMRTLLLGRRDNAIPGQMLSSGQKTKPLYIPMGTIATAAGSTIVVKELPSVAGAISRVSIVDRDALAQDDANYAKFGLINKQGGGGAVTVVDITAANNSTKTNGSGGSAIAANAARALNLTANLNTAANDTLEATVTVVGVLANTLRNLEMKVELGIAA